MPASRLAALASQPAAAPRRQGSFAMDAQPQPGARCVSSARALFDTVHCLAAQSATSSRLRQGHHNSAVLPPCEFGECNNGDGIDPGSARQRRGRYLFARARGLLHGACRCGRLEGATWHLQWRSILLPACSSRPGMVLNRWRERGVLRTTRGSSPSRRQRSSRMRFVHPGQRAVVAVAVVELRSRYGASPLGALN